MIFIFMDAPEPPADRPSDSLFPAFAAASIPGDAPLCLYVMSLSPRCWMAILLPKIFGAVAAHAYRRGGSSEPCTSGGRPTHWDQAMKACIAREDVALHKYRRKR